MSENSTSVENNKPKSISLHSATQAIAFPAGMYRFSVRTASPILDNRIKLPFPALLVAAGPGLAPGTVEFIGNPSAISSWLMNVGDNMIVKITGENASLILSSLRTLEDLTRQFDINVEQVEFNSSERAALSANSSASLKLQLGVFVRGREDIQYAEGDWAGRAGSGMWIEAITVSPQEILESTDIEYKGLAANGFETPWLSEGAICGTKGANMPLVGFAARLKPKVAMEYDCEYSIYFRSGVIVGPLRNGVPGRSKTAGDPLEAIQIRVVKRAKPAIAPKIETAVAAIKTLPSLATRVPPKNGPKFGAFREEDESASSPVSRTKKVVKTAIPKVKKAALKKILVTKKQVKKEPPKKIKPKLSSSRK